MPFNDDFPIPLAKFAPYMIGTPDEIWLHFLKLEHGGEKHSELGWSRIVKSYSDPVVVSAQKPSRRS